MRTVIAVIVALILGGAALPLLFSDLTEDESLLLRIVITAVVFVVVGFIVALIAKRRWGVAVISAWYPLAMGLIMLWVKLSSGGTPPFWSTIVMFLLAAPGFALLGGLAAHKVLQGRTNHPRSE